MKDIVECTISGLHRTYNAIFKAGMRMRKGMDLGDLGMNKCGEKRGAWGKNCWFCANSLLVSMLLWPHPAPHHHILSCLLIKPHLYLFSWMRDSILHECLCMGAGVQ